MFEQHYSYRTDLDQLRTQINQLKLMPKVDCLKLWRTANTAYQEMDREFVNCRRRAKLTLRYQELEAEYQKMYNSLAKRMTLAHLM